jgi:signal transduction histidine kinase
MAEKTKVNEKKLVSEIQTLKKELESVNEKLNKSEAFKSHFISNITNEIINPFTSIIGISKSIMQLDGSHIGQIHSMANLVFNEAFDLDFQLKNIFEAAKIEAGETEIEASSIDIGEIIDEEVERFRFKAEKKNLYFSVEPANTETERFISDTGKLRIIISNLISNAIKFSDEKNKIPIGYQIKNEKFLFTISNKGISLSDNDIKIMFDRFAKLDNEINSLNQGHGLGLSIVGFYVELLDGKIDIVSKANINTVTIELPGLEGYDFDFQSNDTEFFSNDPELF